MKKSLLLILVALVCLLFAMPNNKANAADTATATISFANVSQRTEFTTLKQVWQQNDITVTNEKSKSTNDVYDAYNPARFYLGSTVTITHGSQKIVKIEIDCKSLESKYVTAWTSSVSGATLSNNIVTITFDSPVESVTYSLAAQARANSITVTYISEDSITNDDSTWSALHDEFNYYYNFGNYVKDTVINIDTNKVGTELEKLVHAYGVYNKIDTEKTTTYCGNYLYFENGNGYGTQNGQLTSITVNQNKVTVNGVNSNLPGMEDYYLTLRDFVLGVHSSKHTNDTRLNLTEGWTVDNGVYSNTSSNVIAAFVLFTAPTWLQLEADDYLDYSKVTVEINAEGNLLMKLWVSLGDKEGKLVDSAETDVENAVFSYATIYDANIAKADAAAAAVAKLGKDLYEDLKLDTTLEGYEGLNIEWAGQGVSNNVLTYLNPTEDTIVKLTATVTYKHQVRVVENIEFTHKVPVVVEPDSIGLLATFEFGANGSTSHSDGSQASTSYSLTNNGYTFKFDSIASVYTGARDAKGNSCLKLGTSSKVGSFKITVPENVTEVVIYVAKYKAKTTKINVNDKAYTISGASDNGAYDAIVVDTTTTKTVTFTTVSGGVRAMINTIVFNGYAK